MTAEEARQQSAINRLLNRRLTLREIEEAITSCVSHGFTSATEYKIAPADVVDTLKARGFDVTVGYDPERTVVTWR